MTRHQGGGVWGIGVSTGEPEERGKVSGFVFMPWRLGVRGNRAACDGAGVLKTRRGGRRSRGDRCWKCERAGEQGRRRAREGRHSRLWGASWTNEQVQSAGGTRVRWRWVEEGEMRREGMHGT